MLHANHRGTMHNMEVAVESEGTSKPSKLWTHPDTESTPMWDFLKKVNKVHAIQLKSYAELYEWSVRNTAAFWGDVWEYTGIVASAKYEEVGNHHRFSTVSSMNRVLVVRRPTDRALTTIPGSR